MWKWFLPALALSFAPVPAMSQETPPATEIPKPATPMQSSAENVLSPPEFAKKAAASNLFEIAAAEVAIDRSNTKFVKEFAQQLLEDHGKAQAELEKAARASGVPLPSKLDEAQQLSLQALKDASDADFDSAFLSGQIIGHQAAMEFTAPFADGGDDTALKAYAKAVYPTLHMHHIRAQTGAAPQ